MIHNYTYKYKNVRIRPLLESDIEQIRNWRNDPENTKYLNQIPYITKEMQEDWYKKVQSNPDEMVFAVDEYDNNYRLVGSFSLYNFSTKSAEFGKFLIGDRSAHGKNVGTNCIIALSFVAFNQLLLENIYLHVFYDNASAVYSYKRAGFIVEEEHITDGRKEYLMILKREWRMNDMEHNMKKVKMLEFPQRGDERGHLVIVEGGIDIPFDIKRAFYIYGSDRDVVRGQHANRKSEFVLINVAGTSKVKVKDGVGNEKIYCLNRPHMGIYLPTMVWKDMYDFSADSVLLVLASEHYDSNEYIRNYDEFVEELSNDSKQ